MNTKQVIVIRRDLGMGMGKCAAQASHASMSFLTKRMIVDCDDVEWTASTTFDLYGDVIEHWLTNSFRKITLYVDSEQELDDIHQKAIDSGLMSHMIVDNGATVFNGVQTKTCIAIGPHWDNDFIGLTDHLPLL